MATTKNDEFTRSILDYIKTGLQKEAVKIAQTHKEEIFKEVEDAMSDMVAKMAVRLARMYQVEDMKDHVVITIYKEAK